jgi:hypothetical protein
VASACSARKPAAAKNASETRNRRASARLRATPEVEKASAALVSADARTSQKWDG